MATYNKLVHPESRFLQHVQHLRLHLALALVDEPQQKFQLIMQSVFEIQQWIWVNVPNQNVSEKVATGREHNLMCLDLPSVPCGQGDIREVLGPPKLAESFACIG